MKKYEKHGLKRHPLYSLWGTIKTRCYNKNRENYPRYGGRGIRMCSQWLVSFKSFYDWAMENGWEPGLTIDRIDSDKNYSPSNCRFLSLEENARRSRPSTKPIFAFDRCESLSVWSAMSGIKYGTLWSRIHKLGYSLEEALLK